MAFFPGSRTTWVGRHQKGKPFWILLEQEIMGWQWHQLDHMQIICTSLGSRDRYPRQYLIAQFLRAGCPSCRPTNSVSALNPGKQHQVNGMKVVVDVAAVLLTQVTRQSRTADFALGCNALLNLYSQLCCARQGLPSKDVSQWEATQRRS